MILIPNSGTRKEIKAFTEDEIRNVVSLNVDFIDAIEEGFKDLSLPGIVTPPILQILLEKQEGQTCAKAGVSPRLPFYAIKVSSIFPPLKGESKSEANGLVALFDLSTGQVTALLLDNGYLTQLRTAAAGAIAAKHLAPSHVDQIGIIGGGKQAILQARAAYIARPYKRAKIWARRFDAAQAVADELSSVVEAACIPVATIAEAAAGSQIIVTATKSAKPLLNECLVDEGTHITAMGSDAPSKNELSQALLQNANIVVADSVEQSRTIGELAQFSVSAFSSLRPKVVSLTNVILKNQPGRICDNDITITDLTGLGIQDVSASCFAYQALV